MVMKRTSRNAPLFLFALCCSVTASFGQLERQPSQINQPIDLMAPRLKTEGVTFWIGNKAYRGGKIASVDMEGKFVDIDTTIGQLHLEWSTLSKETREKFQVEYELAVAKKVHAVEREQARLQRESEQDAGIFEISGKVISVADEGLLVLEEDGRVVLLKSHPSESSFVDDDSVSCKAKVVGTYSYTATSGARKTVRAFEYRKQ